MKTNKAISIRPPSALKKGKTMNIGLKPSPLTDEQKEKLKRNVLDLLDYMAQHILEVRRICELDGVMPLEEFDKALNEASDKWSAVYNDMSRTEMATKLILDKLFGK